MFKFQLTSRGKIKALIQKNFLRMWRNIGVMLFIFVLPVMQVILFCMAIGRDPVGLKIVSVFAKVKKWNISWTKAVAKIKIVKKIS